MGIEDLIEALQIFSKYDHQERPVAWGDVLYVYVHPKLVSAEDMKSLWTLGFVAGREYFWLSSPESYQSREE